MNYHPWSPKLQYEKMRNKERLGQWGKGKVVSFSSWIIYTVRLPLFISVQLWERCLRKKVLKWDPNQDLVCNWEIFVFRTPLSTAAGTEQIHPHKWINSDIRQTRNSCVRTFLNSSGRSVQQLLQVREKRVLLSAPSFLEEKSVWGFLPNLRASALCTHREEKQNKWDGEAAFHCRELLELGSLPSFVGRVLGQGNSPLSFACKSRATDGSLINTRSKGKP